MFNKVFKYDFKYMFNLWWIAAITVTGLSVLGGFIIRGFTDQTVNQNIVFNILGSLGIIALVATMFIFVIGTTIMALVRYYKNFYSDEGYLTFTLPVKRETMLNSKILINFLFSLMTIIVVLADLYLMLSIGVNQFNSMIVTIIQQLPTYTEIWNAITPLVIVEIIFLIIFSALMGINMIYLAITFGSIVAKKHKVLAAIGIYYGLDFALGIILQISNAIIVQLWKPDPIKDIPLMVAIFMVQLAAFAVLFYFINLHCIKKKLNLT